MKSKVRCAKSFFICNVAKGISWLNKFVLQYYIIVRIKLSLKEKSKMWQKWILLRTEKHIFHLLSQYWSLYFIPPPLFYSPRHNRLISMSNILRLRKEALQMHLTARWLKWTVFSGFVWCCVLQLWYLA